MKRAILLFLALLIISGVSHAAETNTQLDNNTVTFVVTSADDDVNRAGGMTLREAIAAANANIGNDTITFDLNGDNVIMLNAALGTLAITDDLTIEGFGSQLPIIDGADAMQIFDIADGVDVTMENLSIRNGAAGSDSGGAIANGTGYLILRDIAIASSSAFAGGAIFNADGTIEIIDSTITNNQATYGGGIYASLGSNFGGGQIIIDNSTIDSNTATLAGGGIRIAGESYLDLINNAVISNNHTTNGDGGGIMVSNGTLQVNSATIRDNTAQNNGGGIANEAGILSITATTGVIWIRDNVATSGDGGGIHDTSGNVADVMRISFPLTIDGNEASGNGGGIYVGNGSSLQLFQQVSLTNNKATNNGGGLYQDGGDLTIHGATMRPQINDNEATTEDGGGLYLFNLDSESIFNTPTLKNADVKRNTARFGVAGGVYVRNSGIDIVNTHLHDNVALDGGGLVADFLADVSIGILDTACSPSSLPANTYCTEFRGNRAEGAGSNRGGAIWAHTGNVTIDSVAFLGNSADYGSAIHTIWNAVTNITNALFSDNIAANDYVIEANNPDIFNSGQLIIDSTTIAGNNSTAVGYTALTGLFQLSNMIIWGNGDGVVSQVTVTDNCNIVQNGVGGMVADPQFVTSTRGDYRLTSASVAVDACFSGPGYDLDDIQRAQGPSYDMGAFEYRMVPTAVTLKSAETRTSSTLLLALLIICATFTLHHRRG